MEGSAAKSNIEILKRFQSKVLCVILNAPNLITNEVIHRELQIPTILEEIKKTVVIDIEYHQPILR